MRAVCWGGERVGWSAGPLPTAARESCPGPAAPGRPRHPCVRPWLHAERMEASAGNGLEGLSLTVATGLSYVTFVLRCAHACPQPCSHTVTPRVQWAWHPGFGAWLRAQRGSVEMELKGEFPFRRAPRGGVGWGRASTLLPVRQSSPLNSEWRLARVCSAGGSLWL